MQSKVHVNLKLHAQASVALFYLATEECRDALRIMRRTIVIGDVHGCAEEFEALLKGLKLKPKDRVYQVGDLINRGPDSHRVLKLAYKYDVRPVLGNHEVRLLQSRKENNTESLKSYDHDTLLQLTKTDWKFLEKLPPYIYKPKHKTVIVHAGFLPEPAWYEQDIETITQIQVIDANGKPARQDASSAAATWAEYWHGLPFVVYGHNARPKVFRHPGSIGIDTGCVYGGHLTAYVLEDQSIFQVPAKRKYV